MLTSNAVSNRYPLREAVDEEAGDLQQLLQSERSREEFLRSLECLGERTRARHHVRILAFAGELFAIVLAFTAAGTVRFGSPFAPHVLNLLGFALPVYAVSALNLRCYDFDGIASARVGAFRVVYAFALTLGLVGLATFFLDASASLSRAVFGVGALVAVCLLVLLRSFLSSAGRRIEGLAAGNEVLIKDGLEIDAGSSSLAIDAAEHGLSLQLDDPHFMDRLGRYLRFADRVVVACHPDRRKMWANALKGADVDGEVIAPELDEIGAIGLKSFGKSNTFLVAKSPLRGADRAVKRAFDIALSVAAMPILLPIMLMVAIAVRLDSPGPILFRQKRLGLGNCIFEMYKFRSMYVEQNDSLGNISTARSDRRVTRVGRFIRATSLDELPQVFNVLLGDMSIVGPRPHPILCKAEDRLFWDIDVAYWHRHAMKPGITGLAQVRGFRGTTEKAAQFTNRLQADLEYLEGWSIWRDLAIIFATFKVLVHRNAF